MTEDEKTWKSAAARLGVEFTAFPDVIHAIIDRIEALEGAAPETDTDAAPKPTRRTGGKKS